MMDASRAGRTVRVSVELPPLFEVTSVLSGRVPFVPKMTTVWSFACADNANSIAAEIKSFFILLINEIVNGSTLYAHKFGCKIRMNDNKRQIFLLTNGCQHVDKWCQRIDKFISQRFHRCLYNC